MHIGQIKKAIKAIYSSKKPVIYAGGGGSLFNQDYKSNETARGLFKQLGLNLDRVLFDTGARNTFENAVNSFKLLGQKTKMKFRKKSGLLNRISTR